MREGTAKLLAVCKNMNQSLEAAKSLLTSDTRLTEFRKELQLRKTNHKNKYDFYFVTFVLNGAFLE